MTQVVTWQTPSGLKLNVCKPCETKLTDAGEWPRDNRGEEYCQVYKGLHSGVCEVCGAGELHALTVEDSDRSTMDYDDGCFDEWTE